LTAVLTFWLTSLFKKQTKIKQTTFAILSVILIFSVSSRGHYLFFFWQNIPKTKNEEAGLLVQFPT